MSNKEIANHDPARRVFLKKVAYVAPTIMTVSAVASLAAAASYDRPIKEQAMTSTASGPTW